MKIKNPFREGIIFLGLTVALSYFVFWGPLVVFKIPAASFVKDSALPPAWALALFIIGGFVPSLVGLGLTCLYEGKAGLRRLGKRLIQFNIGMKLYLSAIFFAILISGLQLSLNIITGAKFDYSLFITQIGSLLPLLVLGPISEEIGWRGFALDRLQTRWSALLSGLIIGVIWSLWHLPLFFMIGTSQFELKIPFIGFMLGLTSTSVIYSWLHNRARGSIWMAIFFHWIYTYFAQVVATGVTRSLVYNSLEYVPHIIITMLVVFIWKVEMLKKPNPVTLLDHSGA
jgi:uncharacterized protein